MKHLLRLESVRAVFQEVVSDGYVWTVLVRNRSYIESVHPGYNHAGYNDSGCNDIFFTVIRPHRIGHVCS